MQGLFFIGDSTTRYMFCSFLMILNGGERARFPIGPCYMPLPNGEIIVTSREDSEREFSYSHAEPLSEGELALCL